MLRSRFILILALGILFIKRIKRGLRVDERRRCSARQNGSLPCLFFKKKNGRILRKIDSDDRRRVNKDSRSG
jgi:hypothetical protein